MSSGLPPLSNGKTLTSTGLGSGHKPPSNTPAAGERGWRVNNVGGGGGGIGGGLNGGAKGERAGKVQTVELRIPGKSNAIIALARMDSSGGGKATLITSDKGQEMLARLSWLLNDAGTLALKITFDSIHPPLNLREHLSQPHIKSVLQRLQQQNILTDKQWKILYPLKKKATTSMKYDSRTLITLLETVCHLCPPYPNGWVELPLPTDKSLSADIVRLQLFYQHITAQTFIAGEHFGKLWCDICDVLLRLGVIKLIKPKLDRIELDLLTPDIQQRFIMQIREMWGGSYSRKLMKIHSSRSKSTRSRRSYTTTKGSDYEGLPPEDRVTLVKTFKLLVDTIQAEDILDRLQQSQVIKFSDRQEILSLSKNSDRMQLLLDKVLNTKLSFAFKALCDAIKFKYKKVHENVMAVRKATYKEGVVTTVDVVAITHDALVQYYKNAFSRVYPFPWSENTHASIRDIYCPLDLVTGDGHRLHQPDLLPSASSPGNGQRILLEGPSGSGKTILCQWLAYMWATQPTFFNARVPILIYLNTHLLEGAADSAIYSELMPDNFKLSQAEFFSLLETNGSSVLVIIDGYDESSSIDLSDILNGTRLKKATVLVTSKPGYDIESQFSPDKKWYNLGFSDASVRRCLKTCVNMSHIENTEPFEKLHRLLGNDKWEARPYLALPQLCVLLFATYNILRKTTILKEMKSEFDLLEKYGVAMAVYYCRRQKIDIIGFEFPDEVLRAIEKLDEFAYKCLLQKQLVFSEEIVLQNTQRAMVLKFGAFSKTNQGMMLRFPSSIFVDFLAAKHMADMMFGDMETAVMQHKMVKLPRFRQTMSFLCGQYKDDKDTPILRTLFEQLAARNDYCIKGQRYPSPSSTNDQDIVTRLPRGVIQDFLTSYHCLAECPGRNDVIKVIAESLPPRLIIRLDGLLGLKTSQGLSAALSHQDCLVSEIDVELHHHHFTEMSVFSRLAVAMGQMRNLTSLKVVWSSLDTMAQFLDDVTTRSGSLAKVVLIEDLSKRPVKHVSAATWASLQSACQNMTTVRHLSFLGGRVSAIVNHVIHHIPNNIVELNITGCCMNLMIAGEVCRILEDSSELQFLDLSGTHLNSTEFVTILQGMRLSECIKSIRLRGAKLDRASVTALSECLKLTHCLEVLDLSDCELTTDMCVKLGSALRQNRTLKRLVVKNTKVTSEGRDMISHMKMPQINVVGLQALY